MTGKALRALRQAARDVDDEKITIPEASRRLGVHPNTLMRYERGDNPIPKSIARLAIYALRPIDLNVLDSDTDP